MKTIIIIIVIIIIIIIVNIIIIIVNIIIIIIVNIIIIIVNIIIIFIKRHSNIQIIKRVYKSSNEMKICMTMIYINYINTYLCQ